MQRFSALFLVGLLVTALRCSPERTEIGTKAPSGPFLTIFLIDGLSDAMFQKALKENRLPHLKNLIETGIYVESGITAFPSMTGYGFYPFLTGKDAALSGVLGLRWFDRMRSAGPFRTYVGQTHGLLNEDLHKEPKTLFEHAHPFHSSTINSYNNRGAKRSLSTAWMFTMAKYKKHWAVARWISEIPWIADRFAPDWPEVEHQVIDKAIADLEFQPRVQWITLVSPDTYSHVFGLDENYLAILTSLDSEIGRYVKHVKTKIERGHHFFGVISDHGVEDVERNMDLVKVFSKKGLKAFRGEPTELWSKELQAPVENFSDVDVVVAINGNLMAHVYIRGKSGWRARPGPSEIRRYSARSDTKNSVDLVSTLLAETGVEFVIVRGTEDEFLIHHKSGSARITQHSQNSYSYLVEKGRDPLGYTIDSRANSLVDGKPHAARLWLNNTVDTPYPYGVVRIGRLMAQEKTGDLVVTASKNVDFGEDYELFVGNYRGGHGGLRKTQLVVPFILSGPGLRHRLVDTATAEDVGATFLDILGFKKDRSADGQSLRSFLPSEAESSAP